MLLTQELLDTVGPCIDGYTIGVALGCLNLESEEAIVIFENNNYKAYADWVRDLANNPKALKFTGEYTSISYCVFNPVSNVYITTSEKTHIALIKQLIINDNPGVDQTLITTQEILTTLDGRNLYEFI